MRKDEGRAKDRGSLIFLVILMISTLVTAVVMTDRIKWKGQADFLTLASQQVMVQDPKNALPIWILDDHLGAKFFMARNHGLLCGDQPSLFWNGYWGWMPVENRSDAELDRICSILNMPINRVEGHGTNEQGA